MPSVVRVFILSAIVGMSDLANKDIGHPVKFEVQIKSKEFLNVQHTGHTYTKNYSLSI